MGNDTLFETRIKEIVMSNPKFYGKYKAKVKKVDGKGRVKVTCKEVYGSAVSDWCISANKYAIDEDSSTPELYAPEKGDMVYIEFLKGNPSYPIFTEMVSEKKPDKKIIRTCYKEGEILFTTISDTDVVNEKFGGQWDFLRSGDLTLNLASSGLTVYIYEKISDEDSDNFEDDTE